MDKTLELLKLAKDGNEDAKEQIVSLNLGLVWSVARRFIGRGYELEDIYQIGCIGLLKCIEKFDLSYDVKFSTYAVPMITGEIKRFLRDDGMIKVSRSLKETAYKVKNQREKMVNEQGKEPKLSEIAKELCISEEEIVEAMEANMEVESIHKTIYESDGNTIYLLDKLKMVKDEARDLEERIAIAEAMEKLDSKEQKLISMRYFEDKTQTEIAQIMGISQVQVSRLEKKILQRMRQALS